MIRVRQTINRRVWMSELLSPYIADKDEAFESVVSDFPHFKILTLMTDPGRISSSLIGFHTK